MDQAVTSDVSVAHLEAQVRSTVRTHRNKRTSSCPPEARRSVISGPWSLEWLNYQNHGDAAVIFSASKKSRKGNHHGQSLNKKGQQD
ncbi:DUF4283 domain protein, partial [Trifolium medium]|nr:DUF4283 domain protein [Trifolium medium]